MADETTPATIDEWRRRYPVQQNMRTRKWGWRQFNGRWCENYCTHRDAIRAAFERDLEFQRLQKGATPIAPGGGVCGAMLSPRGVGGAPWVDQSALPMIKRRAEMTTDELRAHDEAVARK